MSWLSKLGNALREVSGELPYLGPILAAVIPGTKDDAIIQKVTAGAAQIEDFVGDVTTVLSITEAGGQALALKGPDKLIMAAGPVEKVILSAAAFAGKKLKDPELFRQGATKIAGGFADCWNAVDEGTVELQKP